MQSARLGIASRKSCWDITGGITHQQADAALVVGAGLRDVAVSARVAPPRILVRVRVAAVLPGVRRLDGACLDLQRPAPRSLSEKAQAPSACQIRQAPQPKVLLGASACALHDTS